MTEDDRTQDQAGAGDFAGALDLLLTDGALGVIRRFRPDGAGQVVLRARRGIAPIVV